MSSRYDSRTTTFSPDGRLHQVEYAVKAIGQAVSAVGILTTEGIVFAAERESQANVLLDNENPEDKDISGQKTYKIADHIGVAVAGITSDANILLNYARQSAHRHYYTYQEPMPGEDLCQLLCDLKQGYTQYGGVRPFGVAFLFGAYDRYYGYQLYHTDPSGNYSAWKAYAIGQHDDSAQMLLNQEWKEGLTLKQGILMAIKVLSKSMDMPEVKADKIEIATLSKPKGSKDPKFHVMTQTELKPLAEEVDLIRQAEERAEAEKQEN